ncbi:MAG: cytochrome c maturation protein CcmE [Halanaerobiaceae bacterium]
MKPLNHKTKVVILTLIIVSILTFLIMENYSQSSAYYMKVSEILKESPDSDKYLRISGVLLPDTITWNSRTENLEFTIKDPETEDLLNIKFNEEEPDNLKDNDLILVEGYYKNNHLTAEQILYQCPSKYEEQVK